MAVEARTYPLPRRNRVGPSSTLDLALDAANAGALTPPRTRVFPFVLHELGNRRVSFATPRLRGPIIIQDLAVTMGSIQDPPGDTVEIGYATSDVTETNALLTTSRPYTVLTELQDKTNVI